jgi:hypothetical protein
MRAFVLSTVLFLTAFCLPQATGEGFCGLKNTSFRAGERVTYKIYYTLAGIYIEAGQVNFSCSLEPFGDKAVYHLVAVGKTLPFYDNFYKVRDRYESFVDTASLQPYKFVRSVSEADHKQFENISFNKAGGTAITNDGVYKVPDCIQDVLSAIYYARNLNFNQMHPGDRIPFSVFLDNEVYPSYIRYLGKETVKTKYGRFHAIKFKPLLIRGTLFKAGEKMTVWVSDDANHIPLRVESEVTVGSVKADLMDFRNLRAPLSSRISLR